MPSTRIDWAKIEAIWEKPEEGYTDCWGKLQVLDAERQDSPGGKPKGRVEGKGIGEKSKYADGFVHVEIKKVNIVSWISTTPDLVILATRHPMVDFSASPSTSVRHKPGPTSTPCASNSDSNPTPYAKMPASSSTPNHHAKTTGSISTAVAPSTPRSTYPTTWSSSSTGVALNPTRNTYAYAMTSSSPSTPIASGSPSSTFDISPSSTTSTPVASSTTSSPYTPYTMSPVDIVRANRPGWLGPRLSERDVSSTYITNLALSYVRGRSTGRG